MHIFVILSQEHVPMAKAEAETQLGEGVLDGPLLYIKEAALRTLPRLAMSKAGYRHIFTTSDVEVLYKYPYQKHIKDTFAVRKEVFGKIPAPSEKELASIVHKHLPRHKVKLRHPDTELKFFYHSDKITCGILLWTNPGGFEQRRSTRRKGFHPSSLDPKLARTMINLSGIKSGVVFDPFCGTGGIPLEASLMGLKGSGSDIEEKMIMFAEKNMKKLKAKPTLKRQDAFKLTKPYRYIVTDLPFGRNTATISNLFYPQVMKMLYRVMAKRSVVGFPGDVDVKKLVRSKKLTLDHLFRIRVHRSLDRQIAVISR